MSIHYVWKELVFTSPTKGISCITLPNHNSLPAQTTQYSVHVQEIRRKELKSFLVQNIVQSTSCEKERPTIHINNRESLLLLTF